MAGVLDQSGWMMCDALELNSDLLTVGILGLALLGSVVILRMLVLFAEVHASVIHKIYKASASSYICSL